MQQFYQQSFPRNQGPHERTNAFPGGAAAPEHVAHLTSLRVVQTETELRDLLTARVPKREPKHPDVRDAAKARGLDAGQERAAAAVASRDPLVVVEGAAGAGKTTMLGVAIEVAAQHGRVSRVIVDEAGMLDKDTALALLTVCDEAGATVALVGDRAQLAAVGRGGVLDMAAQFRGHTFDMAEVHRFADPAYAAVTLRMRDGKNPGEVFDQLARLGLIRLHDSGEEAREHIAQARQDGEAITVSTNDEARTVNARIRDERVSHGVVDDARTVYGNDGLPIGAGDVIQTRKNNTDVGVANRQQWVVQHVEDDGTLSMREAGSGRKRQRTVRLPAEYVAEHAHLSYAATAYGVQGATVAGSRTILTDATSAAGVYVGMTRGRESNVLHVVAESQADARAQFIEAMGRDRADRGLADATRHAVEEVAGLTENGPVRFVNDEMAALVKRAETAEAQAARWQQVSAALASLSDREVEVRERARAAEQEHRAARDALLHRPERAQTERLVAFARVFGAETVIRNQQAYLTTNPMQQATRAAKTAKQAREEAELLRSRTPA